jgi:3-deoxy-D-manno-octulosonic-acid transferase
MGDPHQPDRPMSSGLALYSALYGLSLPLLAPLLALHPRLSGGFGQRLGLRGDLDPPVSACGGSRRPVWLHGSSAGDIVALLPIARVCAAEAGCPPVVSTWTRSGAEMAAARLGRSATIIRAPLDLAGPVRAVVDRLRPALVVLECLELWPRLVSTCHARGVPVAVVNGRLSSRSLRRYQRARWLFEPCFRGIARVVARTPEDARRFVEAGVPAGRVTIGANTKYASLELRQVALSPTAPQGAKVVLGSLHAAEERVLFPLIPSLLAAPALEELVVAPRYPHQAEATRRRLRRAGVAEGRVGGAKPGRRAPRVVVLETMGHLAQHYADARVAFVGGSLIRHGGHNLVEPASMGCPVLFGPHTFNCAQEARLLIERKGGVEVANGAEFAQQTLALLDDPARHAATAAGALSAAGSLAAGARRAVGEVLALVEVTPRAVERPA